MLTRSLLAAALLASAGTAHAATYTFTPGASSPSAGHTVVFDFDTTTPVITGTGTGFVIQSGNDANGAPPAFASPGGNYLAALGGGSASFDFAGPVSAFSFDWGSVDDYNTLTVFGSFGSNVYTRPGDGNQTDATHNGLFLAVAGAGETFTGIRLDSGQNSFEIDNVATRGVPEPSTWGLMILGVGAVGGALRRRGAVRTGVRFALPAA